MSNLMKPLKMLFLTWILLMSLPTTASEQEEQAFQSVKNLFAAMSAFDYEAMRNVVTSDFQLLEVGEDWSIETLINAVKPKGKPYQRRNFFQLIRSETHGNVVWVSYWNKAIYQFGDKDRQVAWMESAVIIKQNDQWKIQMLHSTRLDKDKVPADIQWVEYNPNSPASNQ